MAPIPSTGIMTQAVDFFTVQHPLLAFAFAAVGLIKIVHVVTSYLRVVWDSLLPGGSKVKKYSKSNSSKQPNWAVITGSTAGIGLEFAKQLAKANFNVALVSRSPAKLEKTAQEIAVTYNVSTAVHALDALTAESAQFNSLKRFVEALGSVSVLINNLGISHEMPVPFSEVHENEMRNIVQVNVTSTLEITRAVLPSLRAYTAANKGKRALILSMGSFAGLTPTPLLSVYSGSKLFLQGWSSALAEELKPENIDVQLVLSYLVTSEMSKIRRTSMMIPNPEMFVQSTLRQIGLRGGAQDRAYTLTPYWSHALMHWAIENTLGVYSSIVSKINYNMHVDIRKRALRKKAKTQ